MNFCAFVGGSPTNISVGAKRLGLKSVLLTGIGEDPVGDFILQFLQDEGEETDFSHRKPAHRKSAVALGIEPPNKFLLVFYQALMCELYAIHERGSRFCGGSGRLLRAIRICLVFVFEETINAVSSTDDDWCLDLVSPLVTVQP